MTTILFFDDWALHFRRHMVRRAGVPQWVPEATLEDDIVEGTWNFPFVFREPGDDIWRGLYAGVSYRASDTGKARQFLGLLLAESPDGIHWSKPDVSGLSGVSHRRRANQVFSFHDGPSDGGPVFLDPVETDPNRRLKFLFSGTRGEQHAQYIATSPDGIRWTLDKEPWDHRRLDAPITAFYNWHQKTYTICSRPWTGDRRPALIETPDFRTLSEPQVVVHPDPLDPPIVQFYGMPVYPYEGLYIGLLQCYHTDPNEGGYHKRLGYVDGGLTYSYDGRAFNRTYRKPFIPRTPRGEQGSGGIYPSTLLIDPEHTVRIYSGGARRAHFQSTTGPDAALLLHTLRLDGFAYLESDAGTGYVMTRRLRFSGPDLRLNVRAPYGLVRVQLSEAVGTPIPGFTFDECLPFTGDELFYRPRWRGGLNPSAVSDRLVHLEIEVTHGELYAIRGDLELVVAIGKPG
jgi:hypothetical protein